MSIKSVGHKIWNKMGHDLSPTAKIATSLILKDAVGCYLYVSQARSNKKMTPQQRADVANYDLANGVINIALQLLAIKPIEKAMKKYVESNWLKHFFKDFNELFEKGNLTEKINLMKKSKTWVAGSVAILSTIICQYIIKRVISPFFSVPAGEKAKEIGLIKPKLYDGETMPDKKDNKKQKTVVV